MEVVVVCKGCNQQFRYEKPMRACRRRLYCSAACKRLGRPKGKYVRIPRPWDSDVGLEAIVNYAADLSVYKLEDVEMVAGLKRARELRRMIAGAWAAGEAKTVKFLSLALILRVVQDVRREGMT
jgi:predicted lipid-binding transport protein (Tim44 family)